MNTARRVMSVHEPIRRNSLAFFANPKRKIVSKQRQKSKIFQNNAALFGQLYVAMQTRESDLLDFLLTKCSLSLLPYRITENCIFLKQNRDYLSA